MAALTSEHSPELSGCAQNDGFLLLWLEKDSTGQKRQISIEEKLQIFKSFRSVILRVLLQPQICTLRTLAQVRAQTLGSSFSPCNSLFLSSLG